MADYTVTAANVDAPTGVAAKTLVAGEAITAGMCIYKHTDGKAYKALNDTDAHAACIGIAVSDAVAGQIVTYVSSGSVAFGSIFSAKGALPCVSNTAGKLAPLADISASGERMVILGVTTDASTLAVGIWRTGVTF